MEKQKIIPFKEFKKNLEIARHEQFTDSLSFKANSRDDFEEMRRHLIKYYEELEAINSFKDPNGQVWDCIPVSQQQAIKKSGRPIAQPKDLPGIIKGTPTKNPTQSIVNQGLKDDEGNNVGCPKGFVPVRRLTLEELTRFKSLRDFFRKAPNSRGAASPADPENNGPAMVHKYVHGYQNTNNIGGHSFLNIWQPALVGDPAITRFFYTSVFQL